MGTTFVGLWIGFVAALLYPASALAGAGNSIWQGVTDAVITIAATGFAALIAWLLTLLAKRFKIDIDAGKRKLVQDTVRSIILRVAEESAVAEKIGRKMPSRGKLARAASRLMDKVPGISYKEAEELVEENLAPVGEGANFFLAGVVREATDGDDEPSNRP
jgi:hypothetical protein